jgi:osmotically-inducible protein OsmY
MFRYLMVALLVAPLLQACAPAVVGGAAVGVSVLHDRRTSATVLEDEKIELKARAAISGDQGLSTHSAVGVTSYNRWVLLTGQADSPQVKGRIAALVRDFPEVHRVIDEVTVEQPADWRSDSNDTYITSRVKLALFDLELPDFDPTRVKVVTEKGVVYLMGLVTEAEAAAVVDKVRFVNGVQRVVKIFEYIQPSP